MNIFKRAVNWINNLIPKASIEAALEIEIATSPEMQRAQEMWRSLFFGKAEWNVIHLQAAQGLSHKKPIPSRRTAAQIANEYGRVTVVEHESSVSGSPRADWLNGQYQPFVEQEKLQNTVSMLAAGGELMFKPWPNNKDGFSISIYENNQFYPIKYNSDNELIRFITKRHEQHDKKFFTLLEDNTYNETERRYTIEYKAFKSDIRDALGIVVPLSEIEEWAHLQPKYSFSNVSAWFVHIKMPMQNDIEQSNRNGVSVYSKAVNTIRQIDEHGELTEHEFNAGRLKQNITKGMLIRHPVSGEWLLDPDVFAVFEGAGTLDGKDFITTYNPTPRIETYSQREQRLFREAEFHCQLSYGILSDAQQQAKTATEIHSSLARFDNAIKSVQRTMQKAMKQLVTIMDEMAIVYYPQVPAGNWDMSFFWDDSVIASAAEKQAAYGAELIRLIEAAKMDLIKAEIVTAFIIENSDYVSKLTDKQIEDALAYMPVIDELITQPATQQQSTTEPVQEGA